METANSFALGNRLRGAVVWLLVCAGGASGSEQASSPNDGPAPPEIVIEIVVTDSASQRVAIRFEGERQPRALAVGDAAFRDLRLISVRGDVALLEYADPKSTAPVLLQVRHGATARIRAVPKLSTETTMTVRLPNAERGDRANSAADPSLHLRTGRTSSTE
jgi:hypothetical protein